MGICSMYIPRYTRQHLASTVEYSWKLWNILGNSNLGSRDSLQIMTVDLWHVGKIHARIQLNNLETTENTTPDRRQNLPRILRFPRTNSVTLPAYPQSSQGKLMRTKALTRGKQPTCDVHERVPSFWVADLVLQLCNGTCSIDDRSWE